MNTNHKKKPSHDESVDAMAWAAKELSKMTFGQLLRNLRECDGITLTDLAAKIGVSKQYLSDIERDRRDVSFAFAKKVSDAMGYAIEPMLEIIVRNELKKNKILYDNVEIKFSHQ